MNGSREYLPEALRRFPSLVPVLVEVDASVLRARLLARGREQGGDIEERIARASMPAEYPDGVLRIDNSGELAESTAAFYRMVARLIEEKRIFVSKTDRESYPGNPYCYRTEKEVAASFFLV